MKVHELVRQARMERGLSLAQVAAKLPASKAHIHNLETGKRDIDGMTAARLSVILDELRIVWAWLRSQPGGHLVLPMVPSQMLDPWPAWGQAIGAVASYEQWLRSMTPGVTATGDHREAWELIRAVLMHLASTQQYAALDKAS